MNVEKSVSKLLDSVGKIKNTEARRQAMRDLCFNNNAVATLVQYTYHPNVEFFPFDRDKVSSVPYNNEYIGSPAPMYRAVRQLKALCVKQNPQITEEKRENVFFGMLGVVQPSDKEVLMSVVLDRKLPHKYLTKDFVVEAMPELFPKEEVTA